MTSGDLAKVTGGTLFGRDDLSVGALLTDSRQVSYFEDQVFVAIKGINHDGHKFIPQLYDRGIRIFVVEQLPAEKDSFPGSAFIKVVASVRALQAAASWKRNQFRGKVIAVTGSAGKTVVKEWLADIMGSVMPVIRSPRSYNSQVGVPLSVWRLEDKYSTGIFEAGISRPGEMTNLLRIINPETGIITNIGDAHNEEFKDIIAKAAEKLILFNNCRTIIYCKDYEVIDKLLSDKDKYGGKNLVSWSFRPGNASFIAARKDLQGGKTAIRLKGEDIDTEFVIPFTDRASVENAVTVAIACIVEGLDDKTVRVGLSNLAPVAMRMEIKEGINRCTLIEDYYNSDPGSLGMAIEYLVAQSQGRKSLILSDFLQSGRNETDLYRDVARLISASGIERFIGIGDAIKRNSNLFPPGSRFYASTDDFLAHFQVNDLKEETILLKGARVFEFEKIGMHLEKQVHQTVLEINLDNVVHNLNQYRKHLDKETRIMAMVKAFAYGAGASEIAWLLEYHGIDYLAVAIADEGVSLREAGVSLPIVVMNPEESAFGLMIKYNLEPEIYSFSLLSRFSHAVSKHGLFQYPVHIKIDSGMHRLGFMPGEADLLAEEIRNNSAVKVVSVFSHLAGSEDPALDNFTRMQAGKFLKVTDKLREATGNGFLRHILNSAGITRFPEYQFEMVRPGIGLYGVNGSGLLDLKPAGRYLTRISQLKSVPAGEPVGYGCADVSGKERTIAILPLGYADGLDRKLGNRQGSLFIAGRKVPITGNICMDMCMADVTGLNVREGDEAEIFGRNISVEEVAQNCGTIPYEVLTSIPSRVKRVFYHE